MTLRICQEPQTEEKKTLRPVSCGGVEARSAETRQVENTSVEGRQGRLVKGAGRATMGRPVLARPT